MSLASKVKKLEARVLFLETQMQGDMKEVIAKTMAIYLEENVEFSLSVDGQIKELMGKEK